MVDSRGGRKQFRGDIIEINRRSANRDAARGKLGLQRVRVEKGWIDDGDARSARRRAERARSDHFENRSVEMSPQADRVWGSRRTGGAVIDQFQSGAGLQLHDRPGTQIQPRRNRQGRDVFVIPSAPTGAA